MEKPSSNPPPGWHFDEETGRLLRDTIHHMGRRCRNWDYCGTGRYLITMTLRDRIRPLFGECRWCPAHSPIDGREQARFIPTLLGQTIEAHLKRLPEFSPEIEILGIQLMPDHLHTVLRVCRRMRKPLGEHLRGFKIGCTKLFRAMGGGDSPMDGAGENSPMDGGDSPMDWRELGGRVLGGREQGRREQGEAARGHGLFADGFVDTILFDEEALSRGLDYMRDNPRRLLEKRAHPELFRVVRDLAWHSPIARSPIDGRDQALHFAAVGNHNLLSAPSLFQVQCSRHDFAYARASDGTLRKDAPPAVCTPAFEEKAADLLSAAAHGAVLVSPCISHGEKEIARRALLAGARLVALRNKGFAPLYKPPGLFFDRCVEGRLLLLAPIGWPYLPGEKAITREDACVLNRVAQLLCGPGAAEINYRGLVPAAIDNLVAKAMTP